MAKRSKNFLNTQYAHLEPRNLLAGISLEVFNGFDTVLIDGTNVNDVAFVADASGDRIAVTNNDETEFFDSCLLYTSPSPRDKRQSRMPSSA